MALEKVRQAWYNDRDRHRLTALYSWFFSGGECGRKATATSYVELTNQHQDSVTRVKQCCQKNWLSICWCEDGAAIKIIKIQRNEKVHGELSCRISPHAFPRCSVCIFVAVVVTFMSPKDTVMIIYLSLQRRPKRLFPSVHSPSSDLAMVIFCRCMSSLNERWNLHKYSWTPSKMSMLVQWLYKRA